MTKLQEIEGILENTPYREGNQIQNYAKIILKWHDWEVVNILQEHGLKFEEAKHVVSKQPEGEIIKGRVWSGHVHDCKEMHPYYLIPEGGGDGIFFCDVLKKFVEKHVHISIREMEEKKHTENCTCRECMEAKYGEVF